MSSTACGRRTESATAPTSSSTALGSATGCHGKLRRLVDVRGVVEHDLPEVDGVDAVHQGLVHLGEDGEPAVRQALDQDQLPQRAVRSSWRACNRATSSCSWVAVPGRGSAERRTW